MASWSSRVTQMTQNAISKSKEVAGVTKLSVEIGSLNQEIKNIQTQAGAYVLDNGFLVENSYIAELTEKVNSIKAEIEEKNEKIMELKNVTVCTGCGREVSRNNKFCEHCGTEVVIKVHGTDVTEESQQETDGNVVVTEIVSEESEETVSTEETAGAEPAAETETCCEGEESCTCNEAAPEKAEEDAEG